MDVAAVGGEELLLFGEVCAVRRDDTLGVEHDNVLQLRSERHIHLGAGYGCRAGTVDHDFHILYFLACNFQCVLQSGGGNDCRAVLVVVHDGYVEVLLQALLDVETLRCLDVLKVDSAESRGDSLHRLAEFLGVFLVHFDVEDVDSAVYLEKKSFAFHYRFAAHCAYVAESEHGCAVGYYGHEVAFVGVFVGVVGFFLDFKAWERHTGRVCQRQVGLCPVRLGRYYFDFSRFAFLVITEGFFFRDLHHR